MAITSQAQSSLIILQRKQRSVSAHEGLKAALQLEGIAASSKDTCKEQRNTNDLSILLEFFSLAGAHR